jgi:hypothetical protein
MWLDLEAERDESSRPGSPPPWRATNRSPSTGKDDILNRRQSAKCLGWGPKGREGRARGQAYRRHGAQRTGVHQQVKTTFYIVVIPMAGSGGRERGELKARLTGGMARNEQESINRCPSTGKDDILYRRHSYGWIWRPRGGAQGRAHQRHGA